MALTFKGGVHPNDHKANTCEIPIKAIEGANEHVYPVSQHIGAPAEPIVNVSDRVFVGTKIADSAAFVSAPVHSSVSGTVKAIENRLLANGNTVRCIVVENDFLYEVDPLVKPKGDIENLSPEEIIKIVREAGIVGMGGAGFPTHVKLSPPKDKKIDRIIVNGAECEPYLTSDHRVMLEHPEMVVYGLRAVMKVFGLDEGYIAIEKNKPDAIAVMKQEAEKNNGINVCALKTKYPQGSEKQLIYAVTKRAVKSGTIPADSGCIVINVDTAVAIATAILTGMPSIRRIITVSGDAVSEKANFEVKTGVSLRHVFNKVGGFVCDAAKIIHGGPMMGVAVANLDVPVTKGTSSLLAFKSTEIIYDPNSECIRCGKCVKACPMGLMPLYLRIFSNERDWDMCEKYNAHDCIECGSCSFICPAKTHPVQSIRIGKAKVLEKKRAEAAKKKEGAK